MNNNKYDLTEDEFQKCVKLAEMATFIDAKASKDPTSVFVVSQPGAGKSGLRSYIQSQYPGQQFVEFDPDQIAIYHKYYNEILSEYAKDSYQILQRFIRPALDEYLRYKAVQLKNNIIQEGTFASTDGYLQILRFQKYGGKAPIGIINENGKNNLVDVQGGYNININVLAVHRFESLLSSYEREQYFIENNLPPRSVTKENHDRSYYNLIETLKNVENQNLYNKIKVFRRGSLDSKPPELIYEQEIGEEHGCIEAIKRTRRQNKVRLLDNPEGYLGRIHILKEKIKYNEKDRMILLEKINDLEEEFIKALDSRDTDGR